MKRSFFGALQGFIKDGFGLDYGAVGLWWGLVVGLVIVAAFLIVRVRQREHHGLARIIIDEHAKAVLRTEPVVD